MLKTAAVALSLVPVTGTPLSPSALSASAPSLTSLSGPLVPSLAASKARSPVPEKVTEGVRLAFATRPAGSRLAVVVSVVQDESPAPAGDRKAKIDELKRRFKTASTTVAESLAAMGVTYEESWLISSFKAELTEKEVDELARLRAVENVYLPVPLVRAD